MINQGRKILLLLGIWCTKSKSRQLPYRLWGFLPLIMPYHFHTLSLSFPFSLPVPILPNLSSSPGRFCSMRPFPVPKSILMSPFSVPLMFSLTDSKNRYIIICCLASLIIVSCLFSVYFTWLCAPGWQRIFFWNAPVTTALSTCYVPGTMLGTFPKLCH